MLSLVIPGRAAPQQFQQLDAVEWLLDVPEPEGVADICVFLQSPLPREDCGVSLYFSLPPFQSWEFLGVVTNQRPSALLSTGWPFLLDVAAQPSIRLGARLEGAEDVRLKLQTKPEDTKIQFARKVALNLFHYLESFGSGVTDQRALDTWLRRFEEKFRLDPHFVMRTE